MALYRSLNPTEVLVLGKRLEFGDTIELTEQQLADEASGLPMEAVVEDVQDPQPAQAKDELLPERAEE